MVTKTEDNKLKTKKPDESRGRKKRKRSTDREERLERVVQVSRVTKVVKGGKNLRFRAAIVVGDKEGSVNVGVGKATEVPSAIQKGIAKAKKNMVKVNMVNGTIPHRTVGICGASKVMLRPAPPGTGVIAGGAVRTVLELAGIADIVSKSMGSGNAVNVAKAAVNGLAGIRSQAEVEKIRGKKLSINQHTAAETAKALTVKEEKTAENQKYETIETPKKKIKKKKKEEKVEEKAEEKAEKEDKPEQKAASVEDIAEEPKEAAEESKDKE